MLFDSTLALFATITTAIVLEAGPFLLLGCLLSAAFEVYAPADGLERWLPRSALGQTLAGCFAGILLPTCECGVVPLVRRLLAKGVPQRTALAFLLAAPVANPVVLASTWVAFRGDLPLTVGRVVCVLIPAVIIAMVYGRLPAHKLLRGGVDLNAAVGSCSVAGCGCGHEHAERPKGFLAGLRAVLTGAGVEFLHMGAFLIAGAMAAAAIKTFMPADWLHSMAAAPVIAIGSMMLLAVLLSVCSEADAFVAASFVSFPAAARLSFVGLGPMVDLKLIPLFFAVFSRRLALALCLIPIVSVFFTALAFHALFGPGVGL